MERRGDDAVSITDAPMSHSQELHGREVRYLISMGIRTACFVAAILISGPLRWVLVAGAVFLPYIAVILANAGGRRAPQDAMVRPEPFGALGPRPDPGAGEASGHRPSGAPNR